MIQLHAYSAFITTNANIDACIPFIKELAWRNGCKSISNSWSSHTDICVGNHAIVRFKYFYCVCLYYLQFFC